MLISVAALAMGIVILYLLSTPLPTSVPAFSGIVSNSSMVVYISHEGGDTLSVGQFKILVDGVDRTSNFTQSLTGPFSLGKVMKANLTYYPKRLVLIFNASGAGETPLLSTDLYGSAPFTSPGWYSSSWLYRKKITIRGSQVTGSLTDFPVLIYTGADNDLKIAAQNSGNDFVFTSWDGSTKIPHEIDNYTGTQSGTLYAWVKVPTLTAGLDTVIYLYYKNPSASNQQDAANVWDTNFKGVWHLNENSGTRYDSTSNNNDLTDWNTVARGAGQIAGGADFVRANSEYLYITDATQTGLDVTGPITLEAWAKNDESTTPPYQIISKARGTCGSGDPPYFLRMNTPAGAMRECTVMTGACGTDPTDAQPGVGTITSGTWIHVVGLNDGSYTRVYKNSIETDSEAHATGSFNSDGAVYVGSQVNANYFDGIIDEARISSTARSQDWLTTEYTNMANPSNFITISTEQSPLTMS
jgi:hypothetical protein